MTEAPTTRKSQLDQLAENAFFARLLLGFGSRGRWLRYLMVVMAGVVVFGGLGGAYYFGTAKSYTSGFTLILPGSGAGTSVNLDSLGQADSMTSSPFSSASLSPTQNYKRLLGSDRVRGAAAERLGIPVSALPEARVRLVDLTPLIYVRLTTDDPDRVYASANGLLEAFQAELDSLRQEELDARDVAYRSSIEDYENNVVSTRQAIINFQSQSGLISIEQFQSLVTETDDIQRQLDDMIGNARSLSARASWIAAMIELPEEIASRVLILRGDPTFEAYREALSASAALLASYRNMYGRNHPDMQAETRRHSGLVSALAQRGEELLGVAGYRALRLAEINIDPERAELLRQMVDLSSEASGARTQAVALRNRLIRNRERIDTMASEAAVLEALLREHQVAETVFASALARLDTSRADIFTSYPLVQLLEDPVRPDVPTSPSKKIAAAAALGGFFLYMMGVLLLWLRLPLIRALWKIV